MGKRYLSTRNRIIYPGAIYHITHRAPGREVVFVEDGDYLRMLFLLKKISKEFSWDIFSFVFMRNHFHILLRINDTNLSAGMKKLCERYAKFFNTKYQRKGPVFSRPYGATLCLDDTYLLTISLYIHLNPLKAGICQNLNSYRWSSWKLYQGNRADSFVDPNFVLQTLNKDMGKARIEYLKLIHTSAQIRYKNIIEKPSHLDFFMGGVQRFLKNNRILNDDLEDLLDEFCLKRKLNAAQDISKRKYIIEQLSARGYQKQEIARKLNISRKTLYNTLNYTK